MFYKIGIKNMVRSALVAALYVSITALFLPFSSGLMQVRVSEALYVLAYFTPAAVPGLFIGCVISNIISGVPFLDVLLGSAATLAGAWFACFVRRHGLPKLLSPLAGVVVNAFVVGGLLCWLYDVGTPYFVCVLYVAAGQFIACYLLGIPLLYALSKLDRRFPNIFGA